MFEEKILSCFVKNGNVLGKKMYDSSSDLNYLIPFYLYMKFNL